MPRKQTSFKSIRGSDTAKAQDSKPVSAPVGATKKSRLIAMLSRKGGADLTTLSSTLGWLPHTTRAALSGFRKVGYEITKIKPTDGASSRYQIVAIPVVETP